MKPTLAEVLTAVRDQIDSVLSDVTDLTVHVESGLFRSAEMPAVNIYPATPALILEMASFGDLKGSEPLAIRVAVSPADIEAGEDLLWGFIDDEASDLSIIAALDSDRTLDGVAETLMWGDWAGYQDFGPPDEPGTFVGSTLPLLVVKKRS